MPNRLARETSPYLRAHADNPVDWWPWSKEAFAEAGRRNVPVLLSSGYAACHWCHVMARESFTSEETARLINENYVPIKVDREERPDIDEVYQRAVQAMIGRGGWPLTVFLAPTGEPFFGGTYFPPAPLYGKPGFRQVLVSVARAWRERQADLREIGHRLSEAAREESAGVIPSPASFPTETLVDEAVRTLVARADRRHGGFGDAPKFPQIPALMLLLRHGRLHREEEPVDLTLLTLRQMARGGIHDQLGGGFHRYATDARWLVPHFEQMLYDNAQLLEAYSVAYQITGDEYFAEVVRGIVGYIKREMAAPTGGFYTAQDAESEDVEGGFFIWSCDEVRAVLADERLFAVAALWYGLSASGNFAGKNVLARPLTVGEVAAAQARLVEEVEAGVRAAREKLLDARTRRAKPLRDEKIVLAWNGLAISGLAQAWQALADEETLALAKEAAGFLLGAMRADGAHLYHVYKDGQAKIPAFLDDYAFLIAGLVDLYESDFDPHWLEEALQLQRTVIAEFKTADGHYTLSGTRGEKLIAPAVSGFDQAAPSGVAVHCRNLVRLHALTGDDRLAKEARDILQAYAGKMASYPAGYAGLFSALEMYLEKPTTIAIVGLDRMGAGLLGRVRRTFIPYRVLSARRAQDRDLACHPAAYLLRDRPVMADAATFYVCADCTCHPAATEWGEVEKRLATVSPHMRTLHDGDGSLI